MVNWKGIAILIILLCMMTISVTCVISESFTNKSSKPTNSHKDECKSIVDNVLEHKDTGEEKQVASSESEVESTFILKDSVRRDSKVASTLNYTYLDERCEKLLKPTPPPFPEETMIRTEPLTPLVSHEPPQSNTVSPIKKDDMCKTSSIDIRSDNTQNKSEPFYSEMFDDKELKPKPNVDSPYGFVFFQTNIGINGIKNPLYVYQQISVKFYQHIHKEHL